MSLAKKTISASMASAVIVGGIFAGSSAALAEESNDTPSSVSNDSENISSSPQISNISISENNNQNISVSNYMEVNDIVQFAASFDVDLGDKEYEKGDVIKIVPSEGFKSSLEGQLVSYNPEGRFGYFETDGNNLNFVFTENRKNVKINAIAPFELSPENADNPYKIYNFGLSIDGNQKEMNSEKSIGFYFDKYGKLGFGGETIKTKELNEKGTEEEKEFYNENKIETFSNYMTGILEVNRVYSIDDPEKYSANSTLYMPTVISNTIRNKEIPERSDIFMSIRIDNEEVTKKAKGLDLSEFIESAKISKSTYSEQRTDDNFYEDIDLSEKMEILDKFSNEKIEEEVSGENFIRIVVKDVPSDRILKIKFKDGVFSESVDNDNDELPIFIKSYDEYGSGYSTIRYSSAIGLLSPKASFYANGDTVDVLVTKTSTRVETINPTKTVTAITHKPGEVDVKSEIKNTTTVIDTVETKNVSISETETTQMPNVVSPEVTKTNNSISNGNGNHEDLGVRTTTVDINKTITERSSNSNSRIVSSESENGGRETESIGPKIDTGGSVEQSFVEKILRKISIF